MAVLSVDLLECGNQRMKVLPPGFYLRDVQEVAIDLVGKILCRRARDGMTAGRIVETEAYLAKGDAASHSFKGITRRNTSMFGEPGRAYVYTIHARQCFNVVTEEQGTGSAVLIRAVEPVVGIPAMCRRRRTETLRDLARGPARLCEAFDIGRSFDGWPLSTGGRLWLAEDKQSSPPTVVRSVRIGVTSAEHLPLRFYDFASEFVSGPKRLNVSGASH